MEERIVNSNNNYTKLICYQKAVIIYDLTYHFCSRFIDKRDRTFDQMVQAARSGKQNIVEGTVDRATSYEMALRLVNVARASFKELMEDYKDYLRTREKQQWALDSKEVAFMREFGIKNAEPEVYLTIAESRSDEVIANMVIVLLHQADTLIMRYIRSIEEDFKNNGGVKEKLYKTRLKHRG